MKNKTPCCIGVAVHKKKHFCTCKNDMITQEKDLIKGASYYVSLGRKSSSLVKKLKFEGIDREFPDEPMLLFYEKLRPKQKWGIVGGYYVVGIGHSFFAYEIGIGQSRTKAIKAYGKLKLNER